MRSFRGRSWRRHAVSLALLGVLLMLATPATALEGPGVAIASHSDGDFETSRQVTVHGNATAPIHTLTLQGEDLALAEMTNIRWANDRLVYRPNLVFGDQFNVLDTDKWNIIRDPTNITIENGALKLNYTWVWPAPASNGTLVTSNEFHIPDGVDFQASYRMKVGTYGYSGSGGGISDGATSVWTSHLATLGFWAGGVPYTWVRVIADGRSYYNATVGDVDWHEYVTSYDVSTDRYLIYRDNIELGSCEMDTKPTTWWFGHTEDNGLYDIRPVIEVDYVEVWATSGQWVSDVIDMGTHTVLDGLDLAWNSSHRKEASILVEVRASMDEENWTEWVPFDGEGGLATSVNGTYYQLRMRLGIPDILKETARITVDDIDLLYHHPLVTVEVRTQDTDWMLTEGLHDWRADLYLSEDTNTVEVRAIDTSGAVSVTSVDIIVDTTPPTGTMEIAGDDEYRRDLNVTLLLNATDRYGVVWVDVSHWPDFSKRLRFPYARTLDWRMSGAEGETRVYVRFIDSHGLLSETLTDAIFHDSILPMGDVVIDNDVQYTGSHLVHLTLSYSDNGAVKGVELSNDPDFTEAWGVPEGTTTVNDWRLADGGDGMRTVYIRVTDRAGNVHIGSDDIELYLPKPAGSITIDDGAELTGHTVVRLTIDVPKAALLGLMQLSNAPSFAGADWDTVEEDVMWILEAGDGIKTVHVRFIDYRDIESVAVNDSIRLDQTAPVINVTLEGGSPYTTDTSVTGEIAYQDISGPVRMWVSMDDSFYRVRPVDFTEGFGFSIPARESDHRIYVQVEDEAGNLGVGSAMVHYATIRPYISLALPEGKVVQTTPTIPVEVTPVDPYGDIHVQTAFDQVPGENAPWAPLNGPVLVDVPGDVMDGVHTIYVRARNAAGLTSEHPASIDVRLDTIAPMLAIVRPENGTKVSQTGLGVRLEVDVSDVSKISRLAFTVDGGEPRNLSLTEQMVNVTFHQWGEHTISVVAEDVAGNVATCTSVFTLEDADAVSTGGGTGLLLIVLLAILGAAIVVAYTYNRRFMPGLRPASIHEGEGWVEEWDHPNLEGCDDDRRPCELPVSPEDPVYQARKAREVERAAGARAAVAMGDELEQVAIPEELRSGEGDASPEEDWSEY
jgi:hypothetical protein